eukprot:gnl/Ergobibamus_cyprinoides/3564.p1 GENE.gnl/Ergobibamus_cyprinoides/3564~~gnl/Ergobibamus_cyprinoides/3564.p1  ORF type:complete len:184 (-),score=47.75 gnl/Ergobibamus_cyprinoides/3564:27-578(-)
MWPIESCGSTVTILKHWNVNTALWLRHYVYERMQAAAPALKPFADIVTNLASALWHGLFAGYYVFFAAMALTNKAAKQLHKSVTPLVRHASRRFPPLWWLYRAFCAVLAPWVIAYFAPLFVLLEFRTGIQALAAMRFIPVAVIAAVLVFPWSLFRRVAGIQRVGREYVVCVPRVPAVVEANNG